MRALLLLALLCSPALADWLCYEEAAHRAPDGLWHVCGVAEAQDLARARRGAREAAREEMRAICAEGGQCAGMHVQMRPARTQCDPLRGRWRCRRELIYQLVPMTRDEQWIEAQTEYWYQLLR